MKRQLEKRTVSIEQFSPKVLKSYLFTQGLTFPDGHKLKERYVLDYELEFFTHSRGAMIIDDRTINVQKGDIVFRRPGQYTQGIMPYSCYMVCFDLLGNTSKNPETYDFYLDSEFQHSYDNALINSIPTLFHAPSYEKYKYLFEQVLNEVIKRNEYSDMLLKALVLQILYEAYKDTRNPLNNVQITLSPHYKAVKRVMMHLEENFREKMVLKDLADLSGLSANYFHKIFKEAIGLTPNEFLTGLRIEKAKELLVKTSDSIYEIAMNCGFENAPYFSYLFKKNIGISPGEFRKRHMLIY